MSEILQYKTIESCDKKEFDRLVTEHLNSGWELVEGGYYPSDDLYVRELVWKKKENVDVEFWDNGQISYHRTPNKLICWHENGKIREEGTFKNQEMDGMWTHWFENGMKRTEKNYNNGKITGKWTYWEEDGRKVKEIDYSNRESTHWFDNGKTIEVILRKWDGVHKKDFWQIFKIDGNNYTVIWNLIDIDGKKYTGTPDFFGRYFPIGQYFGVETNENNRDPFDIYDGYISQETIRKFVYYPEYFIIRSNMTLNSQYHKTGRKTLWYKNGQKKEEGEYIESDYKLLNFWENNGDQTVYNGIGVITILDNGSKEIKQYKNGVQHGHYEKDIYGYTFEKGNYINGFKHGEYVRTEYWDEDRKFKCWEEKINFENGKVKDWNKVTYRKDETMKKKFEQINDAKGKNFRIYRQSRKYTYYKKDGTIDKVEGKRTFYNKDGTIDRVEEK